MTMLQIECFLEAAKCSSFSTAAANLFLSQPTLSRHIISLEQELKTTLFTRANNTVRLTGIGRELYPKMLAMQNAFHADCQQLYETIRSFSGRLRLGIQNPQSVDPFLAEALSALKEKYPQANVALKSVELKPSYAQLVSGEIDLLVAVGDTIPPSDQLDFITLYRDQMCLAVPADHPNALLERVASSDIEKLFSGLSLKLIDIEEFESPLRSGLYELVDDRAIRANEMVRGEDAAISSFRLMSEVGLGMSFFNKTTTISGSDRVRLIPLWTCDENGQRPQMVDKNLFWCKGNKNPMIPRFLELLHEKLCATSPEVKALSL